LKDDDDDDNDDFFPRVSDIARSQFYHRNYCKEEEEDTRYWDD
jgi:hypothetical protein